MWVIPERHSDVYDPEPVAPPAPSEYLGLEELLCERCGFIHEPGDAEACVPIPADEQLGPDPDEGYGF
jgi:hypothetical protein